jgi:hypothetical protein
MTGEAFASLKKRAAILRLLPDPAPRAPFRNTPATLPGALQLENFDDGGEGVAYHDTDSTNQGGAYRTNTGVDLQPTPAGGTTLAFARAGEWTQYTLDVAAPGTYAPSLDYASLKGGGRFHLELDGRAVTRSLTLPITGNWQRYLTLALGTVDLPAGRHVLRLAMDANDPTGYVANFDALRFARLTSAQPRPFKGTPFAPNQTIQAEDYDAGGEGISYHDTSPVNPGARYRPGDGVDVEPSGDFAGGASDVGYTRPGEYLTYSVTAPAAGTFALQARVATPRAGARFHAEIDGRRAATFTTPDTNAWQTYVTLTSPKTISLAPGPHTLKLVMDQPTSTGYVANFDWLRLSE